MPERSFSLMNARAAVSALFLVNGFIIGSWAVYIPEFASRLVISEGTLGLMIAAFGLGSLILMPIAGAAIALIGHAPITRWLSLAASTSLFWVGLANNIPAAFAALFMFGAMIAAMDVAMNATAVEVEKSLSYPIMSSCHGFWSLGGLAGAFLGGLLIQNFDGWTHLMAVTGTAILLAILAVPTITNDTTTSANEKKRLSFPRVPLPYLIGIIALFSAMPEGAVIDWSVLYMRTELMADPVTSSTAFALFSGAMAAARFAGDPIRQKLGSINATRLCATIAAIGFLIAGLAVSPWLAIAGFAVTGFGIANLVPIAFSAAGNQPDLPPGIGIAITTTIGYSGVLVFPAILGYVAEYIGFSLLFTLLSVPLITVLALAKITGYGDKLG